MAVKSNRYVGQDAEENPYVFLIAAPFLRYITKSSPKKAAGRAQSRSPAALLTVLIVIVKKTGNCGPAAIWLSDSQMLWFSRAVGMRERHPTRECPETSEADYLAFGHVTERRSY